MDEKIIEVRCNHCGRIFDRMRAELKVFTSLYMSSSGSGMLVMPISCPW